MNNIQQGIADNNKFLKKHTKESNLSWSFNVSFDSQRGPKGLIKGAEPPFV